MPITDRPKSQQLRHLSPSEIQANPENPRLIFRDDEMESLLVSISRHGIQVPLTVFKSGDSYTLIDGERRWRCAKKLALKSVPALVQAKPTELENLVLMYNIHALREQWDYFTIASKLERVIELYRQENGTAPTEIELSELTSLTRGAIRRCQLLLDLPKRYRGLLLAELELPLSQQRLSEDFFIEMERALRAIVKRIPKYSDNLNSVRDTLIEKYRAKTIAAVTDFRQLSKVATAIDGLGISRRRTERALDQLFDAGNALGIRETYARTVAFEYESREAAKRIEGLNRYLSKIIDNGLFTDVDDKVWKELEKLVGLASRALRRRP